MWNRALRFRGLCHVVAALAAGLLIAGSAWADSYIINPAPGYQANDFFTSVALQSHAANGNLLATYSYADGLTLYDRTSGQQLNALGNSHSGNDNWNSFTVFGPGGDSIWVGYDYNIYEVTNIQGTPSWEPRASVFYNFDLAFQGDTPYVVGYGTASSNSLWRLDQGGPTLVATLGGFSAGIAFDAAGNLYYATNLGAGDKLVRYSPAQLTAGNLTLADAEVLADLPFPAYDVAVDAAGHVLFDFNDGDWLTGDWNQRSSTLAVWNGTAGPGENYDLIGTAGAGHWFSFLSVEGNPIDGDGAIYLNDGAYEDPRPGLAEVRPVPEPASLVLLAVGASAWLVWRRKGLRR